MSSAAHTRGWWRGGTGPSPQIEGLVPVSMGQLPAEERISCFDVGRSLAIARASMAT